MKKPNSAAADPRRQRPITVKWRGGSIAELFIDGQLWGEVEWSKSETRGVLKS